MSDKEEVIAALNKFENNYCRGLVGLVDDIRALAVKWGYKKVKVLKEK